MAINGSTTGVVKYLLQTEGAVIGLAATCAFGAAGVSWWFFAAFIMVPDVAMIGYWVGPKAGARTYNAFHSYVLPVGLGVIGYIWRIEWLWPVACIWTAHIGLDRSIGYGLKYAEGFKITHLSRGQTGGLIKE
jgi:hypothetical protein